MPGAFVSLAVIYTLLFCYYYVSDLHCLFLVSVVAVTIRQARLFLQFHTFGWENQWFLGTAPLESQL